MRLNGGNVARGHRTGSSHSHALEEFSSVNFFHFLAFLQNKVSATSTPEKTTANLQAVAVTQFVAASRCSGAPIVMSFAPALNAYL